MSTESRAKASAKFREAQKAAGYRQKAFMLSPGAQAALAKLAKKHGSETKALEALLAEPVIVGVLGDGDAITLKPTPKPVVRKRKPGDNWMASEPPCPALTKALDNQFGFDPLTGDPIPAASRARPKAGKVKK